MALLTGMIGLLDITHGCSGITVTNSYLHDHWKASLIGHSDSNGAQDVAITVTLANNFWESKYASCLPGTLLNRAFVRIELSYSFSPLRTQ
jgi:hypothetical protein